jgi:hypothetical protein
LKKAANFEFAAFFCLVLLLGGYQLAFYLRNRTVNVIIRNVERLPNMVWVGENLLEITYDAVGESGYRNESGLFGRILLI